MSFFCYGGRNKTFEAVSGTVTAEDGAFLALELQFSQADGLRRRGSGVHFLEAQRDQRSLNKRRLPGVLTHSFSLVSALDVHSLMARVLLLLPIAGCE